MTSKSESSLPTVAVITFPSSPPIAEKESSSDALLCDMDGDLVLQDGQLQSPAHSSESPGRRRRKSDDTERPTSAQQTCEATDEKSEEAPSDEEYEDDSDPAAEIVDFDWDNLIEQYHSAINKCSSEEAAFMEEWAALMDYFRVWAESGHNHESDRTFRRLATRSTFVQHEEDKLEKTRAHYVSVVQAFESALQLLQARFRP